jgi:1,4-alpha-glucan branching enzyme
VVTKPATPTPVWNVKRSFVLIQPNAKHVAVSGDFNGWSADATPMRRQGAGRWETTLALEPGRYEYKFLVDGDWIPDPLARENVPNQHGSLNSVVVVRAWS